MADEEIYAAIGVISIFIFSLCVAACVRYVKDSPDSHANRNYLYPYAQPQPIVSYPPRGVVTVIPYGQMMVVRPQLMYAQPYVIQAPQAKPAPSTSEKSVNAAPVKTPDKSDKYADKNQNIPQSSSGSESHTSSKAKQGTQKRKSSENLKNDKPLNKKPSEHKTKPPDKDSQSEIDFKSSIINQSKFNNEDNQETNQAVPDKKTPKRKSSFSPTVKRPTGEAGALGLSIPWSNSNKRKSGSGKGHHDEDNHASSSSSYQDEEK